MFTQQLITAPERRAPGGNFAKLFVIIARQLEFGPVPQPGDANLGFEAGFTGQIALGRAAQFHTQRRHLICRAAPAPQHIEADARTLIGALSQLGLIRVAVIEAWRQRVTSFKIEKVWQDFDDLAIGSRRGKSPNKEQKGEDELERMTHDATIAAAMGDSSVKVDPQPLPIKSQRSASRYHRA